MLIDSHCHLNRLNLDAYQGDLGRLLQAARDVGVKHFLCVCVDLTEVQTLIQIVEKFSDVSMSVGLHPSDHAEKEPRVDDLIALANHPKVVAIGETGLDYHYNDSGFDVMQERFRRHIRAARELKKPLIVHTRDAREDTIRILREEKAHECSGVMHCFTEDWVMAQQAIELGFYISFSGIVTFQNAKNVQEVVQKVPLEKMLIETDAPYLAPVPYRGKPNEPQYVKYVAEKIAELKQVRYEDVVKITGDNFFKLFNL